MLVTDANGCTRLRGVMNVNTRLRDGGDMSESQL